MTASTKASKRHEHSKEQLAVGHVHLTHMVTLLKINEPL